MTRRGEGQATFVADGQTFTLVLDFNAMADFEAASGGKSALETLDAWSEGSASATDVRLLIWAALQEHHPDLDLRRAGQLVSLAVEALNKAIATALPKPVASEDAAGKKPTARRRRAA